MSAVLSPARPRRARSAEDLPIRPAVPVGHPVQLLDLAAEYRRRGNWDQARRYYATACATARQSAPRLLPDALHGLAVTLRDMGHPVITAALTLLTQAAPLFTILDRDGAARRCLLLIAEIALDHNQVDTAAGVLYRLGRGDDSLILAGRLALARGRKKTLKRLVRKAKQRLPEPTADGWLLLAEAAHLVPEPHETPAHVRQYWLKAHRAAAILWNVHAMTRIDAARSRLLAH